MGTKGGNLRPTHAYVQYMVHNMICKEGKTSKMLAAAGIAYVVVCNEVYERRNYEENSDSQGDRVVYEMHKAVFGCRFNPLNPELNPICYLLALLGAHHFLHVSRIKVKLLTLRRLMSYIYIWSTHS